MSKQTTPFELTVKENRASNSLNVIVLQDRIAELEAALNNIIDKTAHAHPMTCVADVWEVARAALAGGKDE